MGSVNRADNAPMAMPAIESRRSFVHLLHRDLDVENFFAGADDALARLIAYDSSCWLSLDPATLLPTSHFTRQIGTDHLLEMAAIEFLEDDVNKFSELARAPRLVGILSEATGGDLELSARHVRVLAPNGYRDGDELRATFVKDGLAWGCVALHRRNGRFDDSEAGVVAELAGEIAEGIRRAILRTSLAVEGEPDPPGLVVLRGDDSVESATPAAMRWLREIVDSTAESAAMPLTVMSVAHDARRAAMGQSEDVATVRLPRRTGGWVRVDASLMDNQPSGRVAVIVSSGHQPEIASQIVELYGLSAREREVTQLVLHGRSTQEMAASLNVTSYTVQDHLKSIFAKVGVRSRRELVATLFVRECVPRLEAGARLGSEGWFAEESPTALSSGMPSTSR